MPKQISASYMLGEGEGPSAEVLRKCHYEVDIEGIDTLLTAQDVTLPRYELEAVEVYHYNDRVKVASRPNVGDVRLDLLDTVSPDIVGELWAWFNQVYNPATGDMGYASDYKKQGKIYLYDANKVLIRTWSMEGIWPKNSPTPDESYQYTAGQEIVKISMTLSVDRCVMDGGGGGSSLVV